MKRNLLRLSALLGFCLVAGTAFSDVKLSTPFTDHAVLQRDKPIAVWGSANSGEKIQVKLQNQQAQTTADKDGNWIVYIPEMKAGGPYTMEVQGENKITLNDLYVGEVWLCSGQSNMYMTVAKEDRYWCGVYNEEKEVASANYPKIRMIHVDYATADTPQKECKTTSWEVVSPQTVGHMSAVAYFFARDIYNRYKIPVGMIVSSYGASTAETWMSKEALQGNKNIAYLVDEYEKACEEYDSGAAMGRYQVRLAKWETANKELAALQKEEKENPGRSQDVNAERPNPGKKPGAPRNPHTDQHSPYVCYNAMIAPMIPYTMRGALWYQGESNGPSVSVYDQIMEELIKDWRKSWGLGEFPFYYVQLANYRALEDKPAVGGTTALTREKQLNNLKVRNTGMVVAMDNANPDKPGDIHPKNKQEIGRRLALIARAKNYGEKNLTYSGPIYSGMEIVGNKVILSFDHVGKGLILKPASFSGFAIAGADGKFVWGDAKIVGNTIVVTSDKISNPRSVSYGFGSNPPITLFNKEGLPASPFRTDF